MLIPTTSPPWSTSSTDWPYHLLGTTAFLFYAELLCGKSYQGRPKFIIQRGKHHHSTLALVSITKFQCPFPAPDSVCPDMVCRLTTGPTNCFWDSHDMEWKESICSMVTSQERHGLSTLCKGWERLIMEQSQNICRGSMVVGCCPLQPHHSPHALCSWSQSW